MNSFIIPTKREINETESCHCFQFVCKGDGCRVEEINQTWVFFFFSHLFTEFKIELSCLEYLLYSFLEQCGNEEKWIFIAFFFYLFCFLV